MKYRSLKAAVRRQWRDRKAPLVTYLILRSLVILTMIRQFMNRSYENVFLCFLTLLMLVMPALIERRYRFEFPQLTEIILLLFVFSAEILGEINAFYIHFPHWDTILHTLNGFLCAALGFSLADLMNRSDAFSLKLSPGYQALMGFCFSMTIGVLWEFFEFGMDRFFFTDMQKDTVIRSFGSAMLDPSGAGKPVLVSGIDSVAVNGTDLGLGGYLDIGLIDTMLDLLVNFIGALCFSICGYFYLKKGRAAAFIEQFISRASEER